MRRIAIFFAIILFSLQLPAQDGATAAFGLDKKWEFKGGAGYFLCLGTMRSGGSIWLESSYTTASSVGVFLKLQHSVSAKSVDVEQLWPSNMYDRLGAGLQEAHMQERAGDMFYSVELGLSRSFILGGGRHRITPGLSLLYEYWNGWFPTHSGVVEVVTPENRVIPVGVIDDANEFFRTWHTIGFGAHLEYTFHFSNGFFMGLRAHTVCDFDMFEGITLSPVFGVRF